MNGKRSLVAAVVAAALSLFLLAGCGGGGNSAGNTGSSSSSSGNAVQVQLNEWNIIVGSTTLHANQGDASVQAGDVTFHVKNTGKTTHAFEIKGNGIDQKTADIEPGQSADLKVTLTAGKYKVWCPVPGHEQLGMVGSLTAK